MAQIDKKAQDSVIIKLLKEQENTIEFVKKMYREGERERRNALIQKDVLLEVINKLLQEHETRERTYNFIMQTFDREGLNASFALDGDSWCSIRIFKTESDLRQTLERFKDD